jgi:hypothetical protein
MRRLRTCTAVFLLASLLVLSACYNFDAVAKFASQSSQALAQGPPILQDVAASCERRHMSEQAYHGLDQPQQAKAAQDEAAQACSAFTTDTPAWLIASKTVTDYFTAISQLASTGATSKGADSKQQQQAAKEAGKTDKSAALMKSSISILKVLGDMATAGYRNKHLKQDIDKVSPDVESVLTALQVEVHDVYNGRLTEEQQTYERRFNVNPPTDPVVQSLVSDDLSTQARVIATKRAAAKAYEDAIANVLSGYKKLVEHQGSLDAKDLAVELQGYTDSLSKITQSLLPLF